LIALFFIQEHAQAAWSRLMARGIDYVLVIVADTTEASEWDPLSAIANKLAQEYIDKVGFAYVGYLGLPFSNVLPVAMMRKISAEYQ